MSGLKPIPSQPGYFASGDGHIWSTLQNSPRRLKAATVGGYLRVYLRGRGHYVHRLICEAFHGAPLAPGLHAAHADGDRTNNAPSNIRWVTPAENYADRITHGTCNSGERHGRSRLTGADVLCIRRMAAEGAPQQFIAKRFNVKPNTVSQIVHRSRWRHL